VCALRTCVLIAFEIDTRTSVNHRCYCCCCYHIEQGLHEGVSAQQSSQVVAAAALARGATEAAASELRADSGTNMTKAKNTAKLATKTPVASTTHSLRDTAAVVNVRRVITALR
jgi:hypothetical protein